MDKAVIANPLILACCWSVMGLCECIFVGFHNSSLNHLWTWKLHVFSCASSYCNMQMTLLRGFSCMQMNTWKITVLLKVSLELEKLFFIVFFRGCCYSQPVRELCLQLSKMCTGCFFHFYHRLLIFPVPLSHVSLVLFPSAWLLNKVTALVTRQRAAYLSFMWVLTEGSAVGK